MDGYDWRILEEQLYPHTADTLGIEASIGAETIIKLLAALNLQRLAQILRQEALDPHQKFSVTFN